MNRWLRGLAIFGMLVVLLASGILFYNKKAKLDKATEPRSWYDNLIFKDESFVFEFIRTIGYSYEGGADIGECISTARRIIDGDIESWYSEWRKTPNRLYYFGKKREQKGVFIC